MNRVPGSLKSLRETKGQFTAQILHPVSKLTHYLLYFPLTVCTKGESRGAWLSPELKAGTGVY